MSERHFTDGRFLRVNDLSAPDMWKANVSRNRKGKRQHNSSGTTESVASEHLRTKRQNLMAEMEQSGNILLMLHKSEAQH